MVPNFAVDNYVEMRLKRRRWRLRRWELSDGRRICMNCASYTRTYGEMRCSACDGAPTSAADELRARGKVIKQVRLANRKLRAREVAEIMAQLPYSRSPSREEVLEWERGASIVRQDAWVLAYILEVRVPDLAEEPI